MGHGSRHARLLHPHVCARGAQVQRYKTELVMDIPGVAEKQLALPLVGESAVPMLSLYSRSLEFGECSLRFPYQQVPTAAGCVCCRALHGSWHREAHGYLPGRASSRASSMGEASTRPGGSLSSAHGSHPPRSRPLLHALHARPHGSVQTQQPTASAAARCAPSPFAGAAHRERVQAARQVRGASARARVAGPGHLHRGALGRRHPRAWRAGQRAAGRAAGGRWEQLGRVGAPAGGCVPWAARVL
jgi:hypothetical protein